jgi:hypothetical protein
MPQEVRVMQERDWILLEALLVVERKYRGSNVSEDAASAILVLLQKRDILPK